LHLEIGLAGDRPQADADRPLERLVRGFLAGLAFVVAGFSSDSSFFGSMGVSARVSASESINF